MVSKTSHPTAFLVDFEPCYFADEKPSLMEYVQREQGYDLAFYEAWKFSQTADAESLGTPESLLSFLDKIQAISIRHLSLKRRVEVIPAYPGLEISSSSKIVSIQGRVKKSSLNGYSFVRGPCSDKEGIEELVDIIWNRKATFFITAAIDENLNYFLDKDRFCIVKNKTREIVCFLSPEQENFKKIVECYEKEPFYNTARIILSNCTHPKKRERQILKIFQEYITQIKLDASPEEKIKTIAITVRDIIQRHIYYDGNGRSSFLLANAFMKLNGLSPFYPRNMCMFEGNSVRTMVQEVISGQDRFVSMFGDSMRLTRGLKDYCDAVLNLEALIEVKFSNLKPLKEALDKRDYNQLLRQSAIHSKYMDIFQLLVGQRFTLNVDIASSGPKSGCALNIARVNGNLLAVELLLTTIQKDLKYCCESC